MDKILIRIVSLSILSISISFYGVSQPTAGRIEGSVRNQEGEPIEFVTVLLRQPLDSIVLTATTTDDAGGYSFGSVASGRYILTMTLVGYQKQSIAVEFHPGETNRYVIEAITLKEDSQLLEQVVVRGQKPLIEQDGDKLILNVQNSVVASGGNAADLLSRVPGVSLDQNDQISINGKQGVTVMIDGKITYLPSSELGTMLRSMNANNVASIELIANPSSRYDATGNSGMINIKTKKNSREGFHGSITTGAGYGLHEKANGNINLNYGAKRWSHFLNYAYTFDRRPYSADAVRVSIDDGHEIAFTQKLNRVQRLPSHTWQAGSEWQWDPKNLITVSSTGSYNERSTRSDAHLQVKPVLSGTTDSTFRVDDIQQYHWYNFSGSLGYKHNFTKPGSELTVDLDHSRYGFNLTDDFQIRQLGANDVYKNEYNILSDQPSTFKIYVARLDYTHRLNEKVSFETGIKSSYVKTVNDVRFSNNIHGNYETDTIRSSDFKYTERISGAYLNMKAKVFGVDAQFGLRSELTDYHGFSVRANKSIGRNYFRVFPTIGLNRSLSKNYQLSVSYSYRVDRPSYRDLYPYVYFFDPFDSQFGNPTLLPQFTHNIQLSQTIAKDYTVTLGYSRISQYMGYAILLYEDHVSSYAIKKNFDTFQNYNLTAIAPVRITNNWAMTCSLNLFYLDFSTQFLDGVYRSNRFSGIANLSQTITLPWEMTGEITAIYNAPTTAGLLETKSLGSLNAGIQKRLFDKKATLRLSIADIFRTNRIRNTTRYPGLDMNIYNYPETRIVRLNFIYNIGMSTGKISRKRNTLEDEQKRVGN